MTSKADDLFSSSGGGADDSPSATADGVDRLAPEGSQPGALGEASRCPAPAPELPGVAQSIALAEPDAWRRLPAFERTTDREFADHSWQAKNSVTDLKGLQRATAGLVSDAFYEDVRLGLSLSPMAMRLSPHLLSLIDWSAPYSDPLRRQFIPVASERVSDHPLATLDPLHEREHMHVPGLTHRYPHKALLLAASTCPVYCRFCTRSYAVGVDTPRVNKVRLRAAQGQWQQAFSYLAEHPEIEDVVVSGGDAYQLRAEHIELIGIQLLKMSHIRRVRFASKGVAVLPQKLLTDTEWTDSLTRVVEYGRRTGKHVALHVHFNHPREITAAAERALNLLFQRGIVVRNQAVLLRSINDDAATLRALVSRLARANVHPYYVYLHDLAKGVEELRTTLHAALELEKQLRGFAAGFNTPCFVVDVMGGGGKRDAHSLEYYDRELGVSAFRSPIMDPEALFYYVDPVDLIPDAGRRRWAAAKDPRALLERVGLDARSRMAHAMPSAARDRGRAAPRMSRDTETSEANMGALGSR